ncbi:copine [Anaeramoeba ignava]|uniref:Copine n=1 Tax=Anaeramoeba ignava TaxID=1746090 RepID=A0A9Q0RD00_ANAIG|nr:copine [Anaeramoeba ignava]
MNIPIQISIICHEIDIQKYKKEDLLAILLYFNANQDKWEEKKNFKLILKDETLQFEFPFDFNYQFGTKQFFNLLLLQDNKDKEKQELIGSVQFDLFEIMIKDEKVINKPIMNMENKVGTIDIQITELLPKGLTEKVKIVIPPYPPEDQQILNKHYFLKDAQKKVKTLVGLRIKIKAENLDKKDKLGKSDPYLKFFFKKDDWKLMYTTEIIKKDLNPTWKEFVIEGSTDDFKVDIKIMVYDWDKIGSHDLIGEFETRFRDILKKDQKFELIHPKLKQKKKNYQNSGVIIFEYVKKKYEEQIQTVKVRELLPPLVPFTEHASIFDYFHAGFDLKPLICIDFSKVKSDASFHSKIYRDNKTGFDYALNEIIPFLQHFIQDKNFFAYRLPLRDRLITLGEERELPGEKIIEYYHKMISKKEVEPGKILVSPVIKEAISYLDGLKDKNRYCILFILLEKDVEDVDETIQALSQASNYPLSVVFIGIGEHFAHKFDNSESKRECSSFFQLVWDKSYFNDEIHHFIKETTGKEISQEGIPYVSLLSSFGSQILEYMRLFRKD